MMFLRVSGEVAKNVIAKLNWIIEDTAPDDSDIRSSVRHTLHEFEEDLCYLEEKDEKNSPLKEEKIKEYKISDEVARTIIAMLKAIIQYKNTYAVLGPRSARKILYEFETGLHVLEEETFRSLITRAIGQASTCWEFPEKSGIFDTEAAVRIVDELCDCKVAAGVEYKKKERLV